MDSLHKELPIKWPNKSFKENYNVFHGRDSRFSPGIICKGAFLIGQVPIKIWVDSCRFFCVELVKLFPVHRYSVDIFSYSDPSGIFGSD